MNNLLSYCGLVDAKIRASDKDVPVIGAATSGPLRRFVLDNRYLAIKHHAAVINQIYRIITSLLYPINLCKAPKIFFFLLVLQEYMF